MKIGCVILAGGKSSRMGEDKALLEFEGKYFIEKIAAELSFFDEKMIAHGSRRSLSGIADAKWKVISDMYPEHGPIGGLHAALNICESDVLFAVSCDVPFIRKELVEMICEEIQGYDAVIAVTNDGRCHPLCAVYKKELAEMMEEHILQDNNRLMAVLKKCQVKYFELDEETSKQLANINTREDYELVLKV